MIHYITGNFHFKNQPEKKLVAIFWPVYFALWMCFIYDKLQDKLLTPMFLLTKPTQSLPKPQRPVLVSSNAHIPQSFCGCALACIII